MNVIKSTTVVFVFVLFIFPLFVNGQNVVDPRIQVEQDHARQADLKWTKKVWRKIDLRQKLNHPLYFSGQKSNGYASFFESLRGSVLSGDLAAFDPGSLGTDDMFHTKFSTEQLDSILNPMENAKTMDPCTLLDTVVSFIDPIETSDVLMYELKED